MKRPDPPDSERDRRWPRGANRGASGGGDGRANHRPEHQGYRDRGRRATIRVIRAKCGGRS